MARPNQITPQQLSTRLQASGPMGAADLAAAFRVNPSTITRNLGRIGGSLVSVGATRSTRYAIRRNIRDSHTWPIHRIDPQGRARTWASLESFHGAWRVTWESGAPDWAGDFSGRDGIWNGFPFFLADARPQGFLGRALARRMSASHLLPSDPRQWQDDDTLIYLSANGTDLPGDLVIGDPCLRQALAFATSPFQETAARYPELAATAASDPPIGSSAGGEQPKFLARIQGGGDVIVKFSPPTDQTTGRRWADLLLMEFHALSVLAGAGLTRPGHRIIEAEDRVFLESPRFDRHPGGGRSGIVSLEALHAAAIAGSPRDWTEMVFSLTERGFATHEDLADVRRLQSFGELIGNNDMHPGNLSFFLTDRAPFALTPAYDMLPMLWAPGAGGEIAARNFRPLPPLPASEDHWREMLPLARTFWETAGNDTRISAGMRETARHATGTLAGF